MVELQSSGRPFLWRLVHYSMKLVRSRWWRWQLGEFGPGSWIGRPFWYIGGEAISIGSNVYIERFARIEAFNTAPGVRRVCIGDGTIIQPFVHIGAAELVELGKGVLIASHVYITDHDHEYSDPDRPPVSNCMLLAASTRIGNYVWLGERAMVLKGVTIGDHSVIGAGSIVTRSIPPYSIAVGAPARVVRRYDRESRRWVRTES